MIRDFTYIDDIVEGIVRVNDKPATPCQSFDSHNPDPRQQVMHHIKSLTLVTINLLS